MSSSLMVHRYGKKYRTFRVYTIITNQPFRSKIGIKDKVILKQFDLVDCWLFSKSEGLWIKSDRLLSEQSPQILYLELCIKIVKPDGQVGIVLPEGLFGNRNDGYI